MCKHSGNMFSMSGLLVSVLICLLSVRIGSANGDDNATKAKPEKTILVFGGNGFIGARSVEFMLRANYSVVIINRGNWYWDSAIKVKPYVKHLKCDRMQSLQRCSELQHYLWSDDAPSLFDAVVDFSAFQGFQVKDALHTLKGSIMRYIYISSDSVYEVCNKTHTGFTREEDAIRPESAEEQAAFAQKDSYGHNKLKCEEELKNQKTQDGGVPYIFLRFPDVVGPRDNTNRWWLFQLWIKLSNYLDKQLSVPSNVWNQPMGFVYVDDAAEAIVNCIESDKAILNQAYNLAMNERPTLVQFLHNLMDVLNVDDIDIKSETDNEGFQILFPSVTLGPLDTTKAKRLLNWNPTSWINILDTTVGFYEDAMVQIQFETTRNDVIKTLKQHFSNDPSKFNRGLKAMYGVTLNNDRDEL